MKRAARRKLTRDLAASKRAEARYVRDLLSIARRLHAAVLTVFEHDIAPANEVRHDAIAEFEEHLGEGFVRRLIAYVRGETGHAFNRMAVEVDKKNARRLRLLGIQPLAAGVDGAIGVAREDNIRLVEDAMRDYAADVREVFGDPENLGLRVEELRDLLVERGNVSDSRAMLIARDQTNKLNGALSRHRQVAAGIGRFIWSTSNDERVRESHAELDGQTFAWADLPDVDGEEAYPGRPIMCRCVAAPVIDDLEEEQAVDEPGYAAAAQ